MAPRFCQNDESKFARGANRVIGRMAPSHSWGPDSVGRCPAGWPGERTCGPDARREGGVPGSNFAHPYIVLLLRHYFFFLQFQCVEVTMVQNRSCKTHLNKTAEVPGVSKTPSDRQASFKCSLKSAPNARCPPPSRFIQSATSLQGRCEVVRVQESSGTPRVIGIAQS